MKELIKGDYFPDGGCKDMYPKNRGSQAMNTLRYLLRNKELRRVDGEEVMSGLTPPASAIHSLRTTYGMKTCIATCQDDDNSPYCCYLLDEAAIAHELRDPGSKLCKCLDENKFPLDVAEKLSDIGIANMC